MVISLFNEKREVIRVRSIHLLSYSQYDENNNIREIVHTHGDAGQGYEGRPDHQ